MKSVCIILVVLLIIPFVYSQEDNSTFRFAVITDTQQDSLNAQGKTSPILEKITNVIINDVKPAFVIDVGDMVGGSMGSTDLQLSNGFQALLKHAEKYRSNNLPFLLVAGNHDVTPKSEMYKTKVSSYKMGVTLKSKDKYQRYYSFTYGNSYFIVLYVPYVYAISSKDNGGDAAIQYNWLKQELDEAKKGNYKHIFVFGHVPTEPLSVSTQGKGTCSPTASYMHPDVLPDSVAKLLADEKVTYFSGHDHVFKEFITDKGVHQVISGHAGAGGYRCIKGQTNIQTNSFVVVDVAGDDVTIYGLTKEYGYNKTFDGASLPKSPGTGTGIIEENIQETTKQVLEQQREVKKGLIGIYSILPSFRTKIDYNISDYNIIKEAVTDANGLIAKVKECEIGSKDVEECVASATVEVNKRDELIKNQLIFFDGPCDTEENVKSDFVENYYACKESPDNECVCTITLDKDPKGYNQEITINIGDSEEDADYETDPVKKELMLIKPKTITGIKGQGVTMEEAYQITMSKDAQGKDIPFYKDAAGVYYIKDGKTEGVKKCRTNKRTFKFCVRDSKKGYWIFNPNTKTTMQDFIYYKFALTFRDNSPPTPVKSLGVIDAPLSERKLIVSWEESPESDVAGYTILKAKSNTTALTNELPFDYVKADERVDKKAILLSKANIVEIVEGGMPTICDYEDQQLKCFVGNEFLNISENILYRLNYQNGTSIFFQIVDVEADDMNYDISVVAFDTSGNELLILNPILRNVSSYDDLPPQIIQFTEANMIDSENVSVTWDRPIMNRDGSPIRDLDGFHIYLSPELTTDAGQLTPIKTMKVPADHAEGSFEFRYNADVKVPLGEGYIAVIAFDRNGNEYKNNALFVQY